MKVSRLVVPAAAAVLITGGLAAPAHAATAHCDATTYPNKVEIGSGPQYYSDLTEGTAVCLKAGTKIYETFVGADGLLDQDFIKNKPGNAYLGISYYAYGEVAEPPCEDYNDNGVCDEDEEPDTGS